MKKFLSFTLSIMVLLTTVITTPLMAQAEGTTYQRTIDGIVYTVDAETGTAEVYDADVSIVTANILSEVDGYEVISIGKEAFYNCASLTSITIPDSVTSIGNWAFFDCDSLTSINVSENNQNYCSENGILFNKDKTKLIQYPIGKTDTSYEIPDSVTSIGDEAFENCTSLTSITIPDSVTSIGFSAFYNCNSLTSIAIPDSATSIGDWAFCNCASLTSITIPDSVTSIGIYAFSHCKSLTSIEIPDSVTSIGDYAFEDCDSLTSINVSENNQNYCSENGVLFNKDKTVLIQYPIDKINKIYEIPKGVTSIGDYAFKGCTTLTSITIPDSVTSIGKFAFFDCKSLTSITIPDSVTSIGDYAFYSCDSLTIRCNIDTTAETYAKDNDIKLSLIGDVNGSGTITSFDIMLTKKAIVKQTSKKEMDINGDGAVNSFDIMLIKRIILYSNLKK